MEQNKNLTTELSNLPVEEPKIQFDLMSDRKWIKIVSEDPEIKEPYIIISGYDLKFSFNFQLLKSIEDIESAIGGIADMFKQMILDELLKQKQQKT